MSAIEVGFRQATVRDVSIVNERGDAVLEAEAVEIGWRWGKDSWQGVGPRPGDSPSPCGWRAPDSEAAHVGSPVSRRRPAPQPRPGAPNQFSWNGRGAGDAIITWTDSMHGMP